LRFIFLLLIVCRQSSWDNLNGAPKGTTMPATPEERREKARLRAERYRRKKGIQPRKPAARPWLALGISRSTYYRHRAEAREQAALQAANAAREAVLDRLDWMLGQMRADLDRAGQCMAEMALVLGEPRDR
jgi:hypothetical protein